MLTPARRFGVGLSTAASRLQYSDQELVSQVASSGLLTWCSARDIDYAADGDDLSQWLQRAGPLPQQPTISKQPQYNTATLPSVGFDDVGEAVDIALDFSGTNKMFMLLACTRASGMPLGFRAGIEYARFYLGPNGCSIMFHPTDERLYAGCGTAGAYQDAYWDGYGSGRHVYACTVDSSLAVPNQLRMWVDGTELTPDAVSGTGMVGNFTASSLMVGARPNGAGGLERGFNGDVYEFAAGATIPSDSDVVRISQAVMRKIGLLV